MAQSGERDELRERAQKWVNSVRPRFSTDEWMVEVGQLPDMLADFARGERAAGERAGLERAAQLLPKIWPNAQADWLAAAIRALAAEGGGDGNL